ncbi:hypothetical protein Q7C18_02810 [Nesterenkonia sp. CL21]|uniref:phage terminase small subunit n=1 Tax=Nesterenkonia sp. CL21 TaxID=3064894 RepID=UPI002878D58C|nr:hypothetical protein [Nesterenkonia sp. CL21]MDS2171620.1 hypothetical protein [Nesterenkonia sp. CL21]
MGKRGPMPKRSEERTRRNKTTEEGLELKKGEALPYYWRDPDPEWDEAIINFYESFAESGIAAFYQQTEVEWLWLACRELNDYRDSPRRSAMQLQAVLSMFSADLGITEGARRRMAIELDAPKEEERVEDMDSKVASMMDRLNATG